MRHECLPGIALIAARPLDVLLFSHDPRYAAAAAGAGVTRVVVDWESSGKAVRQDGRDTEINDGTIGDLQVIRAAVGNRVACRINNFPGQRAQECRLAIEHGATEVWLPMVRSVDEVEQCLHAIDGAAALGLMIETREAMRLGRELALLPIVRAYIGLHDYRIDNGHVDLFAPIVDGTIDRFRDDYPGPLAFAGVTRPGGGAPIPQRLLLAAMVRVRCAFAVARRGFRSDVRAEAMSGAIGEIGAEVARLQSRSPAQVELDHRELGGLLGPSPAGRATQRQAMACVR